MGEKDIDGKVYLDGKEIGEIQEINIEIFDRSTKTNSRVCRI